MWLLIIASIVTEYYVLSNICHSVHAVGMLVSAEKLGQFQFVLKFHEHLLCVCIGYISIWGCIFAEHNFILFNRSVFGLGSGIIKLIKVE